MQKFISDIKQMPSEVFIGIIMIITMSIFLSPPKVTIKADGQGYYDYLPAIFIYNDFPSKGIHSTQPISERINSLGMYIDFEEYKINKYPCGTAVLMSPFFAVAHSIALLLGIDSNGYTTPYQWAILVAAFIYFLLGLFFLKQLLSLYSFSKRNIFFIQILAAFGTGLTHYTYFDPSFSHIYSFAVITAFFYFTKKFIQKKSNKSFLLASLFLGLTVLVRQINGIAILFVPFLAGSFSKLKETLIYIYKKPILFLEGFFIILLLISIQAVLWYVETGHFFVYSYQGEGFNFLHPVFFKVLFSYKKGLFIYTPLLFISLLGLAYWLKQKEFYLIFTWLSFFLIITYIISSWWYWSYGASFGHRAFVDFYSIFFIPLTFLISNEKNKWIKSICLAICISIVPINLIQTKQYKNFILQWNNMNKQDYWKVFLHLEKRYRGVLWKRHYNFNNARTIYLDSLSIGSINAMPKSLTTIISQPINDFYSFKKGNIIQVQFENNFKASAKDKIIVSIIDSIDNSQYYHHKVPLIHFADEKLGEYQTGVYNYEIKPITNDKQYVLIVQVETGKHNFNAQNMLIQLIHY